MEKVSWDAPWPLREGHRQFTAAWLIFRPYSLLVFQSPAGTSHRPTQLAADTSPAPKAQSREGVKSGMGATNKGHTAQLEVEYTWRYERDKGEALLLSQPASLVGAIENMREDHSVGTEKRGRFKPDWELQWQGKRGQGWGARTSKASGRKRGLSWVFNRL